MVTILTYLFGQNINESWKKKKIKWDLIPAYTCHWPQMLQYFRFDFKHLILENQVARDHTKQ